MLRQSAAKRVNCLRESEAHFTFRDWHRVPKHQRRALVVLIVCILCFIVCVSGVVVVLVLDAHSTGTGSIQEPKQNTADAISQSESSDTENTDNPAVFPGGLLAQDGDAGQSYIDETVFLGDSNMVRLYAYGLVPLENVMALEGMGVESVIDLPCIYFVGESRACTIPQAIERTKPRRIIMTFGTNDAGGAYTTEAFIKMYRDAVQAIQKACPGCALILNSIPPVCKQRSYPDTDMETIDAFNEAILELAQELRLPYLNSAEALTGPDGYAKPEYWVEDGLHMNQDALEVFLNYVRTHPYQTEDSRDSAPQEDIPERRTPPGWQSFS